MFEQFFSSFSLLELISLGLNILLILLFVILFRMGTFSNEFVEARTIENSSINYRIESYKTKTNKWMYKVIDMDTDKKIFSSTPFQSKLNLDREVLRKYENVDEIFGKKVMED